MNRLDDGHFMVEENIINGWRYRQKDIMDVGDIRLEGLDQIKQVIIRFMGAKGFFPNKINFLKKGFSCSSLFERRYSLTS